MAGRITDEMVAELLARKGVERTPKICFNEFATKDALRHWVEGIGDPNPLFYDEEYAKATRWDGIINHPTFYFSATEPAGNSGMRGIHALYTGTEWEFVKPLRVGDRMTVTESLYDLIEKRGEFAGRMFQQIERATYRNQQGEITALLYSHSMRMERHTAQDKGKYAEVKPHRYTRAELDEIDACYERELSEVCRGNKPRYWEDVAMGDEMGPIVRGPLTITSMIAYKTGSGWPPFCRAGWYEWHHRRHHPLAYPPSADLNIPDVPERAHWDDGFAKSIGAPAPFDYGPQRVSWAASLVTHWMGDDGWLKKLRVEVRRMSILGDTTWVKGRVVAKRVEGAEHLVECEIRCENQDGVVSAPGHAVVVLPARGY